MDDFDRREKNEFGDVCRGEMRITKSWEGLFYGDIGLSIADGKRIMAALQSAVVTHEAESYPLFRRVYPDCDTFRSVKDYTSRRIRTVFGAVIRADDVMTVFRQATIDGRGDARPAKRAERA